MFKVVVILLSLLLYRLPAYSINVIRDSEVEVIIKDLVQPLFNAAGVDSKQIKIFVINDNSVNAFVIDNKNIFIHSGLLQYSTEPYVLLGVLAHELAHISAGHVLQKMHAADNLVPVIMGSCLLGMISGIVVDSKIAGLVALSGIAFSVNLFHSYTQEQEKMADSYALKYMDESGYDNIGIKEILHYFKSIESDDNKQYIRTHPLNNQRLMVVQSYKVQNALKPIPAVKLLRFKRMVIKLDSLSTPIDVLYSKYKNDDKIYLDSLIHYRKGKVDDAITQINSLIPSDPYLYELKAGILYKAGRLGEAIENYKKFLQYTPDESGLVRFALSHTLLSHGSVKEAISYLEEISNIEPNNALIWLYLSTAYNRDSNIAMYYFALAKKAFIIDDLKQFTKYASLAANILPEDSTYMLQIEDMKKSKS
jgi:predicted Zn-dependent protease